MELEADSSSPSSSSVVVAAFAIATGASAGYKQ